jgi:photosystem II stability/assembly factor-like uncharacterized protein
MQRTFLMNITMFRQFFSQIPERTKTVIIAVLAFGVGTLFGGAGGGNGRYIPVGGSGSIIMDTKTGTTWKGDADHPGTYARLASFSYF